MLCEIGVLEKQRSENPEVVSYRKSCVFSLLDILSVGAFFCAVGLILRNSSVGGYHYPEWLPLLLLYIVLRKIFILRNYSYEIL